MAATDNSKFLNKTDLASVLTRIRAYVDGSAQAGVKCNTTAYWDAAFGFVPAPGEIIVYTDHDSIEEVGENDEIIVRDVPGIKIGTGNAYVQDLVFVDEGVARRLFRHLSDSDIHITAAERIAWNNKLNVNDASEVSNEALVFNRN